MHNVDSVHIIFMFSCIREPLNKSYQPPISVEGKHLTPNPPEGKYPFTLSKTNN